MEHSYVLRRLNVECKSEQKYLNTLQPKINNKQVAETGILNKHFICKA